MNSIVNFPRSMVLIEATAGLPPRYLVTYRDETGAEIVFWDGLSFADATKEANDLRADFGVTLPIADSTAGCRS